MFDQLLKTQMLDKFVAYLESVIHGLRQHQIEEDSHAVDFLRRPNQTPVEGAEIQNKFLDAVDVKMATGTGKTHAELEMAVGMCRPTPEDPEGKRAIIVSPRIGINSHIGRTYTSPQGLHCDPEDIGIYDSTRGDAERQHALNARYLVTTRDGFKSLHDHGLISPDPKNPNYRPLVILDEADTFLGYQMGRILRGEEGLTKEQIEATPLQDRQGYVQNCIMPMFSATMYGVNHHLLGDQEGNPHSLPLVPAVRRGLLARGVKSTAFQVTPDDAEVAAYVQQYWREHHNEQELPNLDEGGEQEAIGSLRVAEKFAMDRAVINKMINFHSQHVDSDIGSIRNFPTLVAAPTIRSAERIAECFNEVFGEDYAVAVSGNTPRENVRNRQTGDLTEGLDSIIERFNDQKELVDEESGTRRRAPRIVIFPDVLGRGVDIRNATVLLSCRNYMTPTLTEQHLGRITRDQDENFFDMFGCDKVAVAANFNLPGIRPWRFRDITGETVVYDDTRERRPAETKPAPLPPPNLPETGEVRSIVTEEQWHQLLAEEQQIANRGGVPQGWHTVEQAAQTAELPVEEVTRRARNIVRNKQYTLGGLPAENGEQTVPGSDLKRRHDNQTILSDTVVQAWREAAQEAHRRRTAGHRTVEDIAQELGVDPAIIREQLRKMQQRGATSENLGETHNLPPEARDQLNRQEENRQRDDRPDRTD